MTCMEEDFAERVWSLHCRGRAISEIAEKLGAREAMVRLAITEKWRKMDNWENY